MYAMWVLSGCDILQCACSNLKLNAARALQCIERVQILLRERSQGVLGEELKWHAVDAVCSAG